jgi:hypothetical protein
VTVYFYETYIYSPIENTIQEHSLKTNNDTVFYKTLKLINRNGDIVNITAKHNNNDVDLYINGTKNERINDLFIKKYNSFSYNRICVHSEYIYPYYMSNFLFGINIVLTIIFTLSLKGMIRNIYNYYDYNYDDCIRHKNELESYLFDNSKLRKYMLPGHMIDYLFLKHYDTIICSIKKFFNYK